MVKNIISTAFVMLSLSSVANAEALFSADKTQDFGVFENNLVSFDESKDGSSNVWRNNLVPLEQSNGDNSMAIKNLDGNKEYGIWKDKQYGTINKAVEFGIWKDKQYGAINKAVEYGIWKDKQYSAINKAVEYGAYELDFGKQYGATNKALEYGIWIELKNDANDNLFFMNKQYGAIQFRADAHWVPV